MAPKPNLGHFYHCSRRILSHILNLPWPPLPTGSNFFGPKWLVHSCTGVPYIVLHVSCWTRTSGGYFRPSEVRFRGILGLYPACGKMVFPQHFLRSSNGVPTTTITSSTVIFRHTMRLTEKLRGGKRKQSQGEGLLQVSSQWGVQHEGEKWNCKSKWWEAS